MNPIETAPVKSLSIRVFPDRDLSVKVEPVTEFNAALTQQIIDMFGALKDLGGIGLSGCQVGIMKQIFIIQHEDLEGAFINPSITWSSEEASEEGEGCLSIPGVYVKVKRANKITFSWQNESGDKFIQDFSGILARCIQHEMDHQVGKTIIDYLSRLKRDIITRKMKKFQKRLERMEEVDKHVRQRALRAQA